MNFIIGIDPGAHGAIAVLNMAGDLLDALDMPAAEVKSGKGKRTRVLPAAVADILRCYTPAHAFIERVGAMPGQGTASMFAFGYAAGIVDGVLSALAVPVTFVTPQSWKKEFHLSSEKGDARQRAMQLWPGRADLFRRVKDADRAEACLIAQWGITSLKETTAGSI